MAVNVQSMINSGESEYQLSCTYYYSFLFSGWWFHNNDCTDVALNGKYIATLLSGFGFMWYNPVTGNYLYPNRSEMKIRRQ